MDTMLIDICTSKLYKSPIYTSFIHIYCFARIHFTDSQMQSPRTSTLRFMFVSWHKFWPLEALHIWHFPTSDIFSLSFSHLHIISHFHILPHLTSSYILHIPHSLASQHLLASSGFNIFSFLAIPQIFSHLHIFPHALILLTTTPFASTQTT